MIKSTTLYTSLRSYAYKYFHYDALKQFITDFPMRSHGYIMTSNKIKPKFYLPNYQIDLIQSWIYTKNEYFEQENLDLVCKRWNNGLIGDEIKDSTIIDVGSNIGNHTLYYLFECQAVKAFCFEPIKSTFAILSKNMKINHLDNKVELINKAVGQKHGNAEMNHFNKNNIGETRIEERDNGSISVVALDEMEFPNNLKLIKIDVEGFELEVIKGMKLTLKKHKPFVMAEIRDSFFDEAYMIFNESGFDYFVVKDFSQFGYKDYLFFDSDKVNKSSRT